MRKKIAIVGAGISGLTAAYLLNREHDITVFEKDERIGGHTATIDICHNDTEYAIDTGFIVFNDWTYPNFIKLLTQINVDSKPTAMGFSVNDSVSGLTYSSAGASGLFAQTKNIFSFKFWRMLKDIKRFNRCATHDLQDGAIDKSMTLGQYLDENNYSNEFCHYYLVPMGAAIWSASLTTIKQFPVYFFVKFFHNHGLLSVFNQPQWHVIKGGSKQYLTPLTASFKDKIVCNADIKHITREDGSVQIHFNDKDPQTFDEVVIAAHSDQALALLASPTQRESEVLGNIPYRDNSVVLHWDETLLPPIEGAWASWNYRLGDDPNSLPVLTYNMNILQGIEANSTFCVTLNADEHIDENKILGRFNYAHPQFSMQGIDAQQRWSEINGLNNTWFCGAYWGNGFHEDGVNSALRVVKEFGLEL